MAGLLLGHLVELVLAICVAHANANTGAHACNGRSRHRCACPRGVERFSTSVRECAPSTLNETQAYTRAARCAACGRSRADPARAACVCAEGRWAHGTGGARRGRPGWCRTPACGWCFLCSHPTAPPPAIAAANTSAAELNALLHRVGAVACQALVCRCRPGGVHRSSLRRGQA